MNIICEVNVTANTYQHSAKFMFVVDRNHKKINKSDVKGCLEYIHSVVVYRRYPTWEELTIVL